MRISDWWFTVTVRVCERQERDGLWTIYGRHFNCCLHRFTYTASPCEDTHTHTFRDTPVRTIYIYIHWTAKQSRFCLWWLKTKQKNWGSQQRARVLSLVLMNPEQILTRPGHIFNLWPAAPPLRGLPGEATVFRGEERESRDNMERERECVCVFMSDSAQCKQLGCCLSPQPSNAFVLRSLTHLQLLWNCF